MTIPIYQVDAFSDRVFAGNPAGVCVLSQSRDATWMQAIAAEMNLSETAFLLPSAEGYDLRWFTPQVEVDLCGHATLASAHVLWETERLAADQKGRFATRSGVLTVQKRDAYIRMDFPSRPVRPISTPQGLEQILGASIRQVGECASGYLVELTDQQTVRELQPDLKRLAGLPVHGVIVTAAAEGGEFDFVSRFFAPGIGIDEDPVTGSAHCALAPYWQERLGRSRLRGFQASQRGGVVRMELAGERVYLEGQAVTFLAGQLSD